MSSEKKIPIPPKIKLNKRKGKFSDGTYFSIILNQKYAPSKLDNKHKKVLVSRNDFTVMLPMGRYEFYHDELTLKGPVRADQFMEAVLNYYSENLTQKDIEKLEKYKEDDCFDYIKDAIEMVKRGENVQRNFVMGDLIFFEGLLPEGSPSENKFYLSLGS